MSQAKTTGVFRHILRAALVATMLALPPTAYAAEPPTAQPSTDAAPLSSPSQGEELGDVALKAGITTVVTLAIELAACGGFGICVFAGF